MTQKEQGTNSLGGAQECMCSSLGLQSDNERQPVSVSEVTWEIEEQDSTKRYSNITKQCNGQSRLPVGEFSK